MENDNRGRDRDLVLAPGESAFVLDTTKGLVNTIVGPNKVSMSNTDQPVIWDTAKRKFVRVDADKAIQTESVAPEGYYIALYNPAENHPTPGTSSSVVKLQVGHRVNIPGPVNFSLWPGQMAKVILGHHLHSNQYLLAQVYNDAEATRNWKEAVVKPATTTPVDGTAQPPVQIAPIEGRNFTPGQLLIIRGTDVAFFIPPTGIKVVPEIVNGAPRYIRDAVTLERLEYCILLDEDGNKRFVPGPDVVFPEPTEQFVIKDGQRKFRAIELNPTTGIYIKVIADYTEDGVEYKTGDELFITGKEQAIYFQREEHSVIRYGDQTKHYAVAVPKGEGRYVLNRNTGVITLVRGPQMLLCDPRSEVIVRRALSESEVNLWFPGNNKALLVNRELEAMNDEGSASQYVMAATASGVPMASPTGTYTTASLGASNTAKGLAALNQADEEARGRSRQIIGDTFQRGTKFTPPRTITLDTKYEGAVGVGVWTGYAVLVTNKTGERRVVEGPENLLLEYDETLAVLELSGGTPKTTDKLVRTVYLRVHNNRVSDIVDVETRDLVKVKLAVAYRVNFEGDQDKWFEVENYVQLLTDHMRSLIRNIVKRKGIEEFYTNTIDIVRDAVLGTAPTTGGPRPGRAFDENGMRIYDLEILNVTIGDQSIASILSGAQRETLTGTVKVTAAEQQLEFTRRHAIIERSIAAEKAQTAEELNAATQRELKATYTTNIERVVAELGVESRRLAEQSAQREVRGELFAAEIAELQARNEQIVEFKTKEVELELRRMIGQTEEIVKRAGAVDDKLAVALTAFSDAAMVERIATALGPMAAMSGVSAADILGKLFAGTPIADMMTALGTRSRITVGSEA